MAFNEKLPKWDNVGVEPPESKKTEGWQPTEKPPAQWFNWIFNRIYKVVQELQNKAVEKETGKGLSTNDYTTTEKNKLAEIETKANKTVIVNNLTETVAGKALDAAQGKTLNDGLVAHKADLEKYAMFKMSANQSIPNATHTQIIWGIKESFNSENFCEIDQTTGKIKILKTGMYQLQVQMLFAGNATGKRSYWGVANNDIIPNVASSVYMTVSEFVYATAGTLLNNRVYQNSGGALDVTAGSNTSCVIRKVV